MITENKNRIIEYLYHNNYKTVDFPVEIAVINPALTLSAKDFNDALQLLLTEEPKKVQQTNDAKLYLTATGIQWHETNFLEPSESISEKLNPDFSDEVKKEIIDRILSEIEQNDVARVGLYATEVLRAKGRTNPVPYNFKSKIEKTITRSKKYLSKPHPRYINDFEIFINPEYNEEKDNLTIQQLRSQNMLLAEQLVDFNKMKSYRNIAVVVSIISIIAAICIAIFINRC